MLILDNGRNRSSAEELGGSLAALRLEPRLTTRERVVDVLRTAILEGRIQSGQRLPEEELAHQLNVSRMPIREAFSILEAEGLLERTPNRGAVVAEFSLDDAEEVCRLRSLLEGVAAERAATRLEDHHLDRLREICLGMHERADAGEFASAAIHLEFHNIVWGAGGRRLATLCRGLYQRFPKELVRVLRHRAAEVAGEHEAILAALARRDAPAAGQAMRRHIDDSGRVMIEHLRSLESLRRQGTERILP